MKQFFTILAAIFLCTSTFAQVGINTNDADGSSALDITSTTKGFLMPRMTDTQRQNISSPAQGLQVFVEDFEGGTFMFYDGSRWMKFSQGIKKPDAPTIGTATNGNGQVRIAFTAPLNNGSAITSYTATSNPGGITGVLSQAGSGIITVTGLTNGTAYTFTVTATNSVGTSSASSASNSVTAASAPSAPTIGTATSGIGQATIAFTAPSSSNGSSINYYTITSSGGHTQTGSNPITITNLTNGTAYTFTVTATNSVGTSSASSASNSVTPAIAPDAPEDVTATSGNGQVTIEFSTPSNNGSAITYYTATSSPGGQTAVLSQAESGTITVTGLTNGTAYTFTVTADNYFGTSSASSASNSVTAASAPSVPTIEGERATGYNGQAAIAFTAPINNGSAITSYTATSNPGGITGTLNQAGSGTITVDGLTNDTAYTFKVTATNGVGTSLVSSASNSVTPFGVGKFLHGGVVFYIFKSGDNGYVSGETHGLVAAVSDQSTGIRWQPTDFDIEIGTTEAVGTGSANTDAIIAAQGGTETSYAAGLARAYTGGSYTDWFLPSKDELNHIYLIKSTINTTAVANGGSNLIISEEGYNTQYYWTSTEFTAYKARSVYMPHSGNLEDGGWQYIHDKGIWNPVRAVRAF